MARQWYSFAVATPAGTPQDAPQVTDIATPAMDLAVVRVVVPSGLNGVLGFRFGVKGGIIIPINAGEWLSPSGTVLEYELETPVNSGAWQLTTYNVGTYSHTLQIELAMNPPKAQEAATYPQPLSVSRS